MAAPEPSPVPLTPVLAAAMARAPRRSGRKPPPPSEFSADNFVAEAKGPDRGNRKGAGAPRGNANAARYPPEWRDLMARMDAFCRNARQAAARAVAAAQEKPREP